MAKTYRTIGAISGHFLSPAERRANATIASAGPGAVMARASAVASSLSTALIYVGVCPVCDDHMCVVAVGDPCRRCTARAKRS